jgi:predicted small metal-binding protein
MTQIPITKGDGSMGKMLRCSDVGIECDAVIQAETEDELMQKVVKHAKDIHSITEITPEIAAKVKAAIQDT